MSTWLSSPLLNTVHGFSTRKGGVSPAPFSSMNLGGSDDDENNIRKNRNIALEKIGFTPDQLAFLKQIHSNHVLMAQPGIQTGDALVTNQKNLPIAVSAADCYPVLFHDEKNNVIGAAHAGWKGTLNRIVRNAIEAMVDLGAEKNQIKIAIGQGISKINYEVSEEIIEEFLKNGFPKHVHEERFLDLLEANRFVALESGIREEHIWCMNRCTTEDDFFSYRRDKGITGRMWGIIAL